MSTARGAEAPLTRKERRERERAATSGASTSSGSIQLEDGAAPIYRTRREMREAATRLARELPITRAADAPITAPRLAPTVAFGPVSAPSPESADAGSAPEVNVPEASVPEVNVPEATKAEPVAAEATAEPTTAEPTTAEPTTAAPTTASIDARSIDTGSAALLGEVDGVVASVLGADAEVDEPTTSARRPLDRDSSAVPVRPVRARKAVAVRQMPAAPSTRPRSREASKGRRVLQKLSAAGAIVFIGSLVAVTSLPAEAFNGATPLPFGLTGGASAATNAAQQQVAVDEGAHGDEDASFYLGTEELAVNDAEASQTFAESELADMQAVADTESVGDIYGGTPAMPEVWSMLETDYTQSPFPSLDEVPISSGFGARWGSFHGGVDMIPGAGTPVFPVANGVVTAVYQGNHPGGGGYEVIVEHNIDGEYYQSWYPHMEAGSILVEEGQVVDIDTPLGAVGSTGNSTGAHLHLEIKNSDYISIDPLVWLQTREEVLEPTY